MERKQFLEELKNLNANLDKSEIDGIIWVFSTRHSEGSYIKDMFLAQPGGMTDFDYLPMLNEIKKEFEA